MPNFDKKSAEQTFSEGRIESFAARLGPFVVAAKTTRMAMAFTDAKIPGNPIIFANESMLKLTGYERDEVLGENFYFLMAQGTSPETLKVIGDVFEGRLSDPEIRYRRKDGTDFWAKIFVSPVRDSGGVIVQHFVSLADTTRLKKEEDRLRFLLDELNHRTQNTLATVLAIAKQTLPSVFGKEAVGVFEGRVIALSKAQALLGRTSWGRVGLRAVIERILEPFGLRDEKLNRIMAEGTDVQLQPKSALSLAMVFHELATNAAKHGALTTDAGSVSLTWQVEPSSESTRMRLLWKERGGPQVTPPIHRGFGSRLIERGLAQEVNGEVTVKYGSTGFSCEIVMPLPEGDGWSSGE